MIDFDECVKYLGSFIEFFSDEEKWLAFRIFSFVTDHVNNNSECAESLDDLEEDGFEDIFEATQENLHKIIKLFRQCAKAKRTFRKRFPKWSPFRLDNTEQLRNLANNINTDRHNCNISTDVGGVVGIVGGGLIVASLAFPPLAIFLGIAGSVAAGLGGATVVGTSIAETTLLKSCLDKANAVKEKDMEEFKLVCGWFKHSQEIIDLFGKIIGFNLATHILDSLKAMKADLTKLGMLIKNKLDPMLKSLLKMCVDKLMEAGIYKSAMGLSLLIPTVVTFFFSAVLLKKHNNLIFGSIVAAHRVVFGLMRTLDLTTDVGIMISRVALRAATETAGEVVTKATARIVATGVFAVLGIALDVVNVVMASKDIHNGSISPHANGLMKLAEELEKEHKVIKSVFEAIEE